MPLAECLVDGQKYFLPDDLQPAAGEELRSLFWPRLRRGHLRTAHRGRPGNRCSTAKAFLPNISRIVLPRIDHLLGQSVGLERRTSAVGRDTIAHPDRDHDDVANAVAGGCRAPTTTAAPPRP